MEIAMAHQSFGFRTLKGIGARLVRNEDDDWLNIKAREGTAGWKEGLLFLRTYSYQHRTPQGGAQHLYRYDCIRQKGLDLIATAFGRTDEIARENLYADLIRKGVKPDDEVEQ